MRTRVVVVAAAVLATLSACIFLPAWLTATWSRKQQEGTARAGSTPVPLLQHFNFGRTGNGSTPGPLYPQFALQQFNFGRTGNQMFSLRIAFGLAMCCSGSLWINATHGFQDLQAPGSTLPNALFSFASPGTWQAVQAHEDGTMLKEASGTFKLRNPEWSLNEVRHAECFSAAQTLSASGYSFDYFSRTGVADWLDRCRQEPPCLECEKFYVGGILADPQCSETGDDELVVHLRSGDIWSEKPHKRYGQPPLSSYAAVLAHRSWKKILIVTEPTPELLRHPFAAILPAMVRQTVADTVQILDFTSDLRTLLCARALVASHSTLTTMYLMHNQRLQSLYADALMHGTQLHNVNGQEVCSAPGAAVLSVSDLLAARPSLSIFLMPLSEEWTPTYTPYGAWKNTYAQRVEMLSAGWGPLLQQPPPPMIECRAGE